VARHDERRLRAVSTSMRGSLRHVRAIHNSPICLVLEKQLQSHTRAGWQDDLTRGVIEVVDASGCGSFDAANGAELGMRPSVQCLDNLGMWSYDA
jgi:hypothetical protein